MVFHAATTALPSPLSPGLTALHAELSPALRVRGLESHCILEGDYQHHVREVQSCDCELILSVFIAFCL